MSGPTPEPLVMVAAMLAAARVCDDPTIAAFYVATARAVHAETDARLASMKLSIVAIERELARKAGKDESPPKRLVGAERGT